MADGRRRQMELNEALEGVGKMGPFQFLMFACLFIIGAFHGARMTSIYYILYEPDHWCAPPKELNESRVYADWTSTNHNYTPPGDFCHIYFNSSSYESQETLQDLYGNSSDDGRPKIYCPNGWDYAKTPMERTAVGDFNLVCDKKLYPSHANLALMLGSLLGAIVFGRVSDRFGRKVCFHSAVIVFVGFGVGMAWSSNFYILVITYAFSGAASTGLFAASLVTAMEFVVPEHRKYPGLLINVFFPIGEMILTGIAYAFRDWRWICVTISAPAILLLSYYWVVPESIKWLMLHKEYKKLDVILKRMARINRRQVPEELEDDDGFANLLESYEHVREEEQEQQRSDSFFHMFKSCTLAQRVVFTCFNWFVVNLAYFGLVYNSKELGQGLFMNFFYGAIVEAPAHLLSLAMVDRIGRKRIHCFYFVLVALSSVISVVVCVELNDKKWILLLMTMVGKFGAAGLTGTSFLWMTELYPTSVRSTGLGVGAASARVGAIVSSYIIDIGDHNFSNHSLGKAFPYIVFAIASALAFTACLFLPETSKRNLPSNIEEARRFGRKPEGDPVPNAVVNYGAIRYDGLEESDA